MAQDSTSAQNLLLSRFSPEDRALLGDLDRVDLRLRRMLERGNSPIEFVYFIEAGLASIVSDAASHTATEIGIIGREGMTGLGLVYGDPQSPFDTFMQIAGSALRCEAAGLERALAGSDTLRALLTKYARTFSVQVATTAIANGRSKLEERLARWLLMVSDRTPGSFAITHEFMAVMLAVRRSGVTLAIQSLEGRGLIRAGRGEIQVIDREGLIEMANGGYGLAEREYKRLLGVGVPYDEFSSR